MRNRHRTLLTADAMCADDHDALLHIAEQVADCFAGAGAGYAFVEEDQIEGLAATLASFLAVAGIRVNSAGTGDPIPGEIHSP
jgi:hypothetical protein